MFGRMPVGGAKPKGQGGAPAPVAPKGLRIEHRIGVRAPAETVWVLIYDVEGWGAWNPIYPEASGRVQIGEALTIKVAPPGMQPQVIKAVVLDWVPNEQLHWRTSLMGGLMRITRFIEIEQLAEESCIVSNGEIFGGPLGPTIARQVGGKIHKGLRLMSEALKEQAETRWKDR